MNTEQAKQLNLPAILAALGHHPVKTTKEGRELWYLSPFRKEKTASFHTSYINGKWIWNDFGGAGGNVIDFALQYLGTSDVSRALAFLAEQTGRVGEGIVNQNSSNVSPLLRRGAGGEVSTSTLRLISTAPITNPSILVYLNQTRRIPEPLIRRHLLEVTYRNTSINKQFSAFGLKNRAGGYEIRSASDTHPFKSVIGPRDLTIIPGSNPKAGIVSLFEGTLDFLSLLVVMQVEQFEGDAVIMHSLSSYQKTVAFLQVGNYQTINLFLDNDQSGVDVVVQFLQAFPAAVDRSELYQPHKDLNEYLLASSPMNAQASSANIAQLKAKASRLQQQLHQQTEEICRALFQKHPGAKAVAYGEARESPASGFRVERSIAENMANPTFREAFKWAVEQRYPQVFTKAVNTRNELNGVLQELDNMK